VTKREKGADRRERLEAVQREQKAEQRKRNAITAIIGVVAGVLIIGGTVAVIAKQEKAKPQNRSAASYGVAAASAACDPEITDVAAKSGNHVGPGTNTPKQTFVKYATVPPTSGPHYPTPLPSTVNFYAVSDKPQTEQLVHNLEHGYTVVWYLPTLPQDQVDDLKGLAANISGDLPGNKFIVAPWDDAHGAFPAGKTVAMSHWGAKNGYRQLCGRVSGAAIKAFVDNHPYKDSPEPNAA
jgi:hypothetical protein